MFPQEAGRDKLDVMNYLDWDKLSQNLIASLAQFCQPASRDSRAELSYPKTVSIRSILYFKNLQKEIKIEELDGAEYIETNVKTAKNLNFLFSALVIVYNQEYSISITF